MKVRQTILPAILAMLSTVAFANHHHVALTITVNGATPGKGQIILSLFSSADNFLKNPIRNTTSAVGDSGSAKFRINDLPPGEYAISVVYDEDKNGKLNLGLLGIPKELVGFSNNAKGLFGPPKFSKAAFPLNQTAAILIQLGKAKN